MFKYERKVFENIMKQFPEIADEVTNLAMNREKMRSNQDNIKSMI